MHQHCKCDCADASFTQGSTQGLLATVMSNLAERNTRNGTPSSFTDHCMNVHTRPARPRVENRKTTLRDLRILM